MTSSNVNIYIQMDEHIRTKHTNVHLKDIAQIVCLSNEIKSCIEKLRMCTFNDTEDHKKVITLLYVYEQIEMALYEKCSKETGPKQGIELHSLGAANCLVEHYDTDKEEILLKLLKISVVSLITFFGAAFSIMTYNQDAAVEEVFQSLYGLLQIPLERQWILELSYSVGIGLGVILFFHHFGQKSRCTPTVMEIQMNQYEKSVVDAAVTKAERSKMVLEANDILNKSEVRGKDSG